MAPDRLTWGEQLAGIGCDAMAIIDQCRKAIAMDCLVGEQTCISSKWQSLKAKLCWFPLYILQF